MTEFSTDIKNALEERRLFNLNGTSIKFSKDIKQGIYHKINLYFENSNDATPDLETILSDLNFVSIDK